MTRVDWDDIRFFLAVAQKGKVAQAATSLSVNYTTVTRRISDLESKLKVRLFDRSSAGWAMTIAAEHILPYAIRMQEDATAFDRTAFGQDAQLEGEIRIATSDAVAARLLVPNLAKLQHAHPRIRVALLTSDSPVNLDLREADLAVRISSKPPDHLVGKRIATVGFGVFASKRYAEGHEELDSEDVAVLTWTAQRDKKPPWVRQSFPRASLGPQFDSAFPMLCAVKKSVGIALLPHFLIAREPGLVCLPERGERATELGLWILHHPDLRTSAKVRVLSGFLAEILLGQIEQIEGPKPTAVT